MALIAGESASAGNANTMYEAQELCISPGLAGRTSDIEQKQQIWLLLPPDLQGSFNRFKVMPEIKLSNHQFVSPFTVPFSPHCPCP